LALRKTIKYFRGNEAQAGSVARQTVPISNNTELAHYQNLSNEHGTREAGYYHRLGFFRFLKGEFTWNGAAFARWYLSP
jgi:hypothetical protein